MFCAGGSIGRNSCWQTDPSDLLRTAGSCRAAQHPPCLGWQLSRQGVLLQTSECSQMDPILLTSPREGSDPDREPLGQPALVLLVPGCWVLCEQTNPQGKLARRRGQGVGSHGGSPASWFALRGSRGWHRPKCGLSDAHAAAVPAQPAPRSLRAPGLAAARCDLEELSALPAPCSGASCSSDCSVPSPVHMGTHTVLCTPRPGGTGSHVEGTDHEVATAPDGCQGCGKVVKVQSCCVGCASMDKHPLTPLCQPRAAGQTHTYLTERALGCCNYKSFRNGHPEQRRGSGFQGRWTEKMH